MRPRGYLTVGLALLALCSVGVASANEAPQAEAGLDQEGTVNATIYLNAGGSIDPDGTIEEYIWSIETPNGSITGPECPTCRTTWFVPSQPGQYNVTIQVEDNYGEISNDTMFINTRTSSIPASEVTPDETGGSGVSGSGSPGQNPGSYGNGAGCSGCGGSGDTIDAIVVNEGGRTLLDDGEPTIVAGNVEPGDTVEVGVANGENVEIDGRTFTESDGEPGELPVSQVSAMMAEQYVNTGSVDDVLSDSSLSIGYETSNQIGSTFSDSPFETDIESIQDGPSDLVKPSDSESSIDTADSSSSSSIESSDDTSDIDFGRSSSSLTGSTSVSTSDVGSNSDTSAGSSSGAGSLDGIIGPVGPHP